MIAISPATPSRFALLVMSGIPKGKPAMLDVAGNLLSIPVKILDLVQGVKSLKRESADRASELFRHISEALGLAAAEIRQGRTPHGVCGQLMGFADDFQDATKGVLEPGKASQLAQLLHDNYNIERFAAMLPPDDSMCEFVARQLEESSGRFMALSHLVRAKA